MTSSAPQALCKAFSAPCHCATRVACMLRAGLELTRGCSVIEGLALRSTDRSSRQRCSQCSRGLRDAPKRGKVIQIHNHQLPSRRVKHQVKSKQREPQLPSQGSHHRLQGLWLLQQLQDRRPRRQAGVGRVGARALAWTCCTGGGAAARPAAPGQRGGQRAQAVKVDGGGDVCLGVCRELCCKRGQVGGGLALDGEDLNPGRGTVQ